MFGRRIRLFKLVGFEVAIDTSWFILAILITWSLAKGYFPHYYKGLSENTYWLMGAIGTIGLFFSILFHEFSHSLVARRFGIPIKGITLFIFGGVAHMEEEPPNAKSEFFMAIAGPLSSYFLAIIFYLLSGLEWEGSIAQLLEAEFSYLAFINTVLATFNLIPGFPLDGGRVLRSALWYWKKDLRLATKIASQIGSGFGVILILMGILSLLTGNIIGGIWWTLIGLFLKNASEMSYQQLTIRKALEGEQVRRFMKPNPMTVPPSLTLKQLVEDYFYKYHYKMFPVTEESKLLGFITTRHIKHIPPEQWTNTEIADVFERCSEANTIDINEDAINALAKMNRTENSRLMVLDKGNLAGIITLKDLMKFLSVKLDLESDRTTENNNNIDI